MYYQTCLDFILIIYDIGMKNLLLGEGLFSADDADLMGTIDREHLSILNKIKKKYDSKYMFNASAASIDLERSQFEGRDMNIYLSGTDFELDHSDLTDLRKLNARQIRFIMKKQRYADWGNMMVSDGKGALSGLDIMYDAVDPATVCEMTINIPGEYLQLRNVSLKADKINLGNLYNFSNQRGSEYVVLDRGVKLETDPKRPIDILLNWGGNESIEDALDRIFKNRPVLNAGALSLRAIPLKKFYFDRNKKEFVGGMNRDIIETVRSYTGKYKFRYVGITAAQGGYVCICGDGQILDREPR